MPAVDGKNLEERASQPQGKVTSRDFPAISATKTKLALFCLILHVATNRDAALSSKLNPTRYPVTRFPLYS